VYVTETPYYKIETGERRWLAHHLLKLVYPDTNTWHTIPAKIEPRPSLWRQAEENNVREGLNAIGKARQFALLLMDLHDVANFKTYEEMQGQGDRAFYAQVSDGTIIGVPRGRGEQIAAAMGISRPDQLRLYRALLRLPDEVWQLADEYSIPEVRLRDIMSDEMNEATKVALVMSWLSGKSPAGIEEGPEESSADEENTPENGRTQKGGKPRPPKQPGIVDYAKVADRWVRKLEKPIEQFESIDDRLNFIREMKRAIVALEKKYNVND
jgi:hypothetical protein